MTAPAMLWPLDELVNQVALSLVLGLLVGFEREWAQKDIGVRTFAIVSLLGVLACSAGESMLPLSFVGVMLVAVGLNAKSLLRTGDTELTTSAALMLMFVLGALIGHAHYFAASCGGILLTMLLAWKVEMARFAGQLQPKEIRGAVLLGLLSFVIYPLLPNRFVDPLQLLNPRQAWVTIVLLAGLGFVNYVLLRLFRARGLVWAAFLGGLINSTLTVVEMAPLLRPIQPRGMRDAERILFLPTLAMFLRNLLLVAALAPQAASEVALPLLLMMGTAALVGLREPKTPRGTQGEIALPSPVELWRIAKSGLLFVALAAVGTLAQRQFGAWGFLAVSIVGGIVSSASATATAATLATSHAVSFEMAGTAVLFASIASAFGNLPLIYDGTRHAALSRRLSVWTCLCAIVGLLASFFSLWLSHP